MSNQDEIKALIELRYDPANHQLMHAVAPNVSGVPGSAVAAGILLSFLL